MGDPDNKSRMLSRIVVAMMGARRHYAIPRMLHQAGRLEHFYTDIVATQGFPRLLKYIPKQWQPRPMQRLAGRVPSGIPTEKITSFPVFGLSHAYKLSRAASLNESLDIFTWAAKEFAILVETVSFRNADTIYTFDRCGLELMQAARVYGLNTIMEQTVAPFRINQQLLREERDRFPGWEQPETVSEINEDRFSSREEAEWEMADIILCGSEYVKDGVIECGGPGDRCKVVPYGVDSRLARINRKPHDGPLRVLTVGSIGLNATSRPSRSSPWTIPTTAPMRKCRPLSFITSIGETATAT